MLKMVKHSHFLNDEEGQSTVEAAIMIPVIFLLLLLLIQPSLILYDLIIMKSAASDTCRVLATCNENEKYKVCDAYLRRRLSAIPQQNNFHKHDDKCSYDFELKGCQSSQTCSVTIKNKLEALPLIAFLSDIFGILNSEKCFEISATSELSTKPK